MRAYLMGTVSLSAMMLSLMLYWEQDNTREPDFLEYRKKAAKALISMTVHGKPYQPMFRRTHFIKPDNLNEAPLVQS